MSIEIRACRLDDFPAAPSPISHYFGRTPGPEFLERFGRLLPPDRMHAAFEDGQVVAEARECSRSR